MEEELKEPTALKVSDVIDFSEEDYKETKRLIRLMNKMVLEYVDNVDNPDALEALKRNFNAQLMYLATFYAKILCYREQFQYLESQRKELKAIAIQVMMREDSSIKYTNAEKTVYAFSYYSDRMKLLEKLKNFFYLVELMYKNYENTQRSIYQSVSHLNKEKQSAIS